MSGYNSSTEDSMQKKNISFNDLSSTQLQESKLIQSKESKNHQMSEDFTNQSKLDIS
jgi:hypothetical protein